MLDSYGSDANSGICKLVNFEHFVRVVEHLKHYSLKLNEAHPGSCSSLGCL